MTHPMGIRIRVGFFFANNALMVFLIFLKDSIDVSQLLDYLVFLA